MKIARIAALAAALALTPLLALAQTRVLTTQTKVTIAVTNTYQEAIPRQGARNGCTLQYNGATNGYVFFGAAAPADTTTSWKLGPGQAIYCGITPGATASDAVQVTGTATDVFVVSYQ